MKLPEGARVRAIHALVLGALSAPACGDDTTEPPPNDAPVVTAPIPAQTVHVGERVSINLSAHFQDPNGDPLSFAAESSDDGVATASTMSGDTLTLTAVRQGTTDITIEASDPGGLSARQSLAVNVPNRPPVLTDSIPVLQSAAGDSVTIDLSAHFSDPDGDSLGFTAESSDTAVVMVDVSHHVLMLVARRHGKAELAVTARDAGGMSASQSVAVNVPNRPPVVSDSIPGLKVFTGDSVAIDLSSHFSDPDGDSLRFTAESSDTAVAMVVLAADALTVLAVGRGDAVVKTTVHDVGGLSVSHSFTVNVPNRPPALTDSIPGLQSAAGDSVVIDLSAHFSDPDGDSLGFTAESSDEVVATVSVSGLTLVVRLLKLGRADILVTARDPPGLDVMQSFSVTALNRAPTGAAPIPEHVFVERFPLEVDLLDHFLDPDGDSLSFFAESLDSGVATVFLSGATLTVSPGRRGTTSITVTARDPGGLAASGAFSVTTPNRQPIPTESIGRQAILPRESTRIPLAEHFSDPDADALVFSVQVSVGGVAAVSISGGVATVRAVSPGSATVLVIARDTNGLSASQAFTVTVPDDPERAALAALYEATDGSHWNRNHNWLTEAPIGSWDGVRVNAAGQVTELQIFDNNLAGQIPPELGWLTSLTTLSLGDNALTGTIPPELGKLNSLTWLDLSSNSLGGTIPPELGRLQNLARLDLSDNRLTGSLPAELGNLRDLQVFYATDNMLEGPIPTSLGNLTNLALLWLRDNELTGSIPPELANLRHLRELLLNRNNLTGPIPEALADLSNLTKLGLGQNSLTGDIPREVSRLTNLTRLDLGSNALTGHIPTELARLSKLEELTLAHNNLVGSVPQEFGGLAGLTLLRLDFNYLTGTIPSSFPQLTGLDVLRLVPNNGLCVPGVAHFAGWVRAIRGPVVRFCNDSDIVALSALYDATGGPDWTDSRGWTGPFAADEMYGVVTDSQGRVVELNLTRNGLVGQLPSDIGQLLPRLSSLTVSGNALSGPLPASLTALPLKELDYADTGLCGPRDASFQAWLDAIPAHQGNGLQCPLLSDREVLLALYAATGGPGWTDRNGWASDKALDGWHGVTVDASSGRVTHLDLHRNNLAGPIPPELGALDSLETLILEQNDLTGPIPSELANLTNLRILDLSFNDLAGQIPTRLGQLIGLRIFNLRSNHLSGTIPEDLASLANLAELDLENNELSGTIPPDFGSLKGLRHLSLARNQLSGAIPPELGGLRSLRSLILRDNSLSGALPPELGNLTSLSNLNLSTNRLTGHIPGTLSGLDGLLLLYLDNNQFTGLIPAELGELVNLRWLFLDNNDLTGPIPAELGSLARLTTLILDNNRLTGPIPDHLGRLVDLRRLELDNNDLEGTIPLNFGELRDLRWLYLHNNRRLSGSLPGGLTNLDSLTRFHAGGTRLCAPPSSDFVAWLAALDEQRVAMCVGAMAYLTQTVQSLRFPVPLVAGEEALLRVFLTTARSPGVALPSARASFHVNGRQVHSQHIPGQLHTIPTQVDESSLSGSVNARIPGWVVQPGLEMVVEVDPGATLDSDVDVPKRIPATGRLALDVRTIPPFDVTFVPFLWIENPDSAIVGIVEAMAADPHGHELLWDTRTQLPVNEMEVTAHPPVLTSQRSTRSLFAETAAIRVMEGNTGHYMGMMSPMARGAAGVAGRNVTFSRPDAKIMAHEFGHSFSLGHAPCGSLLAILGGVDPLYPVPDGSIGTWGFDFRGEGRLVHPSTPDLMSYCNPTWISEYHFTKALQYRLETETAADEPAAAPTTSLLLWGGIDTDNKLFLEPVFVVDAPAALPSEGGEYRLRGTATDGRKLFDFEFDMQETADGGGAASFVFAQPVEPQWAGALASVTLSGPTGSVILDGNSDQSMTILRDTRTRQVRGIVRSVASAVGTQGAAVVQLRTDPGLEVLFSRGIPDAAAWRR